MDRFAVIDTKINWHDQVMSIGTVITDTETFQFIGELTIMQLLGQPLSIYIPVMDPLQNGKPAKQFLSFRGKSRQFSKTGGFCRGNPFPQNTPSKARRSGFARKRTNDGTDASARLQVERECSP